MKLLGKPGTAAWYVSLAALITIVLLGTWGFQRYDIAFGAPQNLSQNFFDALILFSLETELRHEDADGHFLPWQIHGARVSIVLLYLMVAAAAIGATVRADFRRWRAGSLSGHVIITGLNPGVRALAANLLKSGRSVVLLAPEPDEDLSAAGAVVFDRAAPDEAALSLAGAGRAAKIVIASENDAANLDAMAAAEAAVIKSGQSGSVVEVLARISDPPLYRRMAAERRNLAAAPNLRVTLLNEKYLALRKVFNTHPFELAAAVHGAERPHFLCIGFGRMGASIVLHILKTCVYDPATPVMITIIDQGADAAGAAFRDANPWANDFADITFIEAALASNGQETAFNTAFAQTPPPTAAFIALGDDEASLAACMALTDFLKRSERAIPHVFLRQRAAANPLGIQRMTELFGADVAVVRTFGAVQDVWADGDVLRDAGDRLARAIHERYLAEYGANANPAAAKPWAELGEQYRNANRAQADHIAAKLRLAECSIGPDAADTVPFTPREIEHLAAIEHRRWMVERLATGWRLGPRVDRRRTHPNLIPFAALDEDTKAKDRSTVHEIAGHLGALGQGIRRDRRVALRASTGQAELEALAATHPGDWIVIFSAGLLAGHRTAIRHLLDQGLADFVAIPLCHDGLSLTDALPGEAERDLKDITARARYSLLLDLGPNFDAPADDAAAIIAATDAAATLLAARVPGAELL